MEKRDYILVTGGNLSEEFVGRYISGNSRLKSAGIICVDRGLDAARRLGLVPELIIGDFDSADKKELSWWKENEKNTRFIGLKPEKDFTDTHTAILEAIKLGAGTITIFGATGGRQDHFLCNLNLLLIPMKKGIPASIIDPQNRISLAEHSFEISKQESFGKYISFIPFIGPVTNVTMKGFKYETEGITMDLGDSLGVSNEILEEKAIVTFDEGVLIVAESCDSFY